MLKRFLDNREAIKIFVNSAEAKAVNKNQPLPDLTAIEWDQLKIITDILGLIDEFVKGFFNFIKINWIKYFVGLQDRDLTIGFVIPAFNKLRKTLTSDEHPIESFDFCDAVLAKLNDLRKKWTADRYKFFFYSINLLLIKFFDVFNRVGSA